MKIYTNKVKESWIIDRLSNEWHNENSDISTIKIKEADIVWVIANWVWKDIPKKYLKKKKVVASVYHIDFSKFDKKQEKDFYELDKFVEFYHVISEKTKNDLKKLTDKKIVSIPFWINQDNWFNIKEKDQLRKEFGISTKDNLIGSFQRDTEGADLTSPKLIKGPDIFFEIVQDIYKENKNTRVILTGTRRQYLIGKLEESGIPYNYYEMVDISLLNKLYNTLDLYLVTSRLEGGPQAILECAITKTPILSTNVGVAPEILHKDAIFKPDNFDQAELKTEYAYKQSQNYNIPKGMKNFLSMFEEAYEG